MTVSAAEVRELVAHLPDSIEGSHHGHPDFRVKKKIFATLFEGEDHAALRLPQLEARQLAQTQPDVYRLVGDRDPFSWVGVSLERVDAQEFADLLEQAWSLRR
ncbi:MAG TPA: MmcQ/YjbR family DNA-binding protein [Chloroflexota bacterium]|nr:MmcQ/YjbR family DNA-binding protein [Chloroflexota bacterium]